VLLSFEDVRIIERADRETSGRAGVPFEEELRSAVRAEVSIGRR
jgi:hypothetical protein